MQRKKLHNRLALVLSAALVGLLAGCGGGGGTGTGTSPSTTAVRGIALPQEVSAISADNSTSTAQATSLRGLLRAAATAASQLPADSDYNTEVASKYVDEPALEVFNIIDTILKAAAQTHYADSANVNAGPYKVLVAWYDQEKGQTMKQVQKWKVESTIDANGSNIVYVWPQGDHMPSAVELKIDTAPTQAADGSYSDYGKWSISAKFDPTGSTYFVATADIDSNGMTVLTINQNQQDNVGGYPVTDVTQAIVHKANGSGYGQVLTPDYEACDPNNLQQGQTNPCESGTVPETKVEYAYNQDYLTYQKLDGNGNPIDSQVYKDRNSPVEMDYRYGLYDATGTDVQKIESFGFPVTYTDTNGATQQAYYGSWQGLHQLWANGNPVPDGTTVTRADVPPNQTAPTYTVKSYPGSLTKRTLVGSDIGQLLDIPVQAFVNNNLTLVYQNGVWNDCVDPNWGGTNGLTCASTSDFTSQLSTLESDPTGQKMVNINGWDQVNQQSVMYAYSGNGNSFDIIDQNGNVTGTYTPQAGDNLNVSIGGNIYIEYTGNFNTTTDYSGWVQKTLTSFDQNTNTPTFGTSDQAFDFADGAQYYLNNNGVNFVVDRTATNGAASDYVTSMEIQTVANPANAATVVPAGTVFKQQWDNSTDLSTDPNSTFAFQGDPSLPHYLMLVYHTVSQPDGQAGHSVGDVVTDSAWGLFAYDQNGAQLQDANNNPIQYNWQYATNSDDWGTATYLVDGNGTYKLLDDPIMLQPVQLTTKGGTSLNFSLQYDGYMHGLPDMHQQLEQNNYQLTPAIGRKVVDIPAGTYVTDESGNGYFIKPLEIGVILPTVTLSDITTAGKTAPDLTSADQIDLSAAVPTFVDPNVPAAPTGTVLKYIEGNPVQ